MNILCVQTGGTIDKDYPKTTKGYAFEINNPAVERILKKTNPSFRYRIQTALRKDSTEITPTDRTKIFQVCARARERKILITHGTDTMVQTGKKLSGIKNKIIVITGAMRPEMFSNSDADFNIGVAVGALDTVGNGVYIAMHGKIIPWNKAKRNMKTGQFLFKK